MSESGQTAGASDISKTSKEQFKTMTLQTSLKTGFTEFVIHTFSPEKTPIKFFLPEQCLAADVKSKAGEHLHLNKISLEMFGLFIGPLGSPIKHIPDEVTVGDYMEFCLQRILFNGGNEILLIRYDTNALDLLYWEMRFIFDSRWKCVAECPSVSDKIKYVGDIHILKEYWKYYYSICNCMLHSNLVIGHSCIPSGTPIKIALNSEKLFILNVHNAEMICFEWQQVADVIMHANTKELVKFRIRNRENRIIAVASMNSGEYLFSLAIHIIKMNEEKFGVRSRQIVPSHIHEYLVFSNSCGSAIKSSVDIEETKKNVYLESELNLRRSIQESVNEEELQTGCIASSVLNLDFVEGVKESNQCLQCQKLQTCCIASSVLNFELVVGVKESNQCLQCQIEKDKNDEGEVEVDIKTEGEEDNNYA